MCPVSFLTSSEQYCEDLDGAFHLKKECFCCHRPFSPSVDILPCHVKKSTGVNINIKDCFELYKCSCNLSQHAGGDVIFFRVLVLVIKKNNNQYMIAVK